MLQSQKKASKALTGGGTLSKDTNMYRLGTNMNILG